LNQPLLIVSARLFLAWCASRRLQQGSAKPPPVSSREFADELAAVGKVPWTTGNVIRVLENGGIFFPAMPRAVQSARKTIVFESFVNIHNLPVLRFSETFAARARAGASVLVGSWYLVQKSSAASPLLQLLHS